MGRALYAMMRVPDVEVRLTTTTAIATTTGLIIIMYLVMCYFSNIAHRAHSPLQSKEHRISSQNKPFQRQHRENF